jgi:hypothetical protein
MIRLSQNTIFNISTLLLFLTIIGFINNVTFLYRSKFVPAVNFENNSTSYNIYFVYKDDLYYKNCEYFLGNKVILDKNYTLLKANYDSDTFLYDKIYEPYEPFCIDELFSKILSTIFYLVSGIIITMFLTTLNYDEIKDD